MTYTGADTYHALELYHHGIKDMKWGIRRFQNKDGSLTELGKARYAKKISKEEERAERMKKAEQSRNDKILSDPKFVYKYRNEFSVKELAKALEKMEATNRLKTQIEQEKTIELRAKLDRKQLRSKAKINQERSKLENEWAKEEIRSKKLENDNKAKSKFKFKFKSNKNAGSNKAQKLKTSANIWSNRANKAQSIKNWSTDTKKVLDDMGVTNPNSGRTLLGELGVMLGFKELKVPNSGKNNKP